MNAKSILLVSSFLLLVWTSLLGCQLLSEKVKKLDDEKEINLNELSYVILPYKPAFQTDFDTEGTYRCTKLNPEELVNAEKILSTAILKYNCEQETRIERLKELIPDYDFKAEDFSINLKDYSRQYIPVINEREEKEIWINFFCDQVKEHPYWEKEVIFVMDGGKCYFSIVVNLSTMNYSKFYVNGGA